MEAPDVTSFQRTMPGFAIPSFPISRLIVISRTRSFGHVRTSIEDSAWFTSAPKAKGGPGSVAGAASHPTIPKSSRRIPKEDHAVNTRSHPLPTSFPFERIDAPTLTGFLAKDPRICVHRRKGPTQRCPLVSMFRLMRKFRFAPKPTMRGHDDVAKVKAHPFGSTPPSIFVQSVIPPLTE